MILEIKKIISFFANLEKKSYLFKIFRGNK